MSLLKLFKDSPDGKEIKCSICRKYLSVAPISHSPSLGYVCGRCREKAMDILKTDKAIKDMTLVRQVLYEDIAKYLVFPCTYKPLGCSLELKWGEVELHENLCQFRNTICPLSEKNKLFLSTKLTCNWRDNNKQLKAHLTSCHREYFVDPPQVQLQPKYQTKFLFTEVLQHIMMVIFKYQQETDKYAVHVLSDLSDMECNFFRFQIEVFNEHKSSSIMLRRNRIEPYCDYILESDCNEGALEMDIKMLKESLKNKGSFFVQIGITKKSKKDIKLLKNSLPPESVLNIPSAKNISLAIDEDMLQELECPVCNDYMVPPIFICQAGHSVCEDCNRKIDSCPTCRSPMLKTRNFTLEKLTGLVNYPCKNRSTGCYFVTSSEKIRVHERSCMLTGKRCILKCPWEGNSLEMIIHLNDKHTLLELGTVENVFLNAYKKREQKAVVFENQIFLFSYAFGYKMPFQYSLKHLQSDNTGFKYELIIVDKAGNDLDLVLRHKCLPLSLNQDPKNDVRCSLPYDLIKDLVWENRELNFKVNMFRLD